MKDKKTNVVRIVSEENEMHGSKTLAEYKVLEFKKNLSLVKLIY